MQGILIKSKALSMNPELLTKVVESLDSVLNETGVNCYGEVLDVEVIQPEAEVVFIMALVPAGDGIPLMDEFYPTFSASMSKRYGKPAASGGLPTSQGNA